MTLSKLRIADCGFIVPFMKSSIRNPQSAIRNGMIARIWKGIVTSGNAAGYAAHLRDHTFPRLSSIAGYRGGYVLSRPHGERIELTVMTLWESLDAIRQFAGDDPEAAVVPPEAQALLASFDTRASHWNVLNADSGRRIAD